jgi:hypothetical protein
MPSELERHKIEHLQLGFDASGADLNDRINDLIDADSNVQSGVLHVHDRLHDIDSITDHSIPHSSKWGNYVRANPNTGTIEFNSISGELNSPLYGDGSDGTVRIAANTTLTRDMYYQNLTIDANTTVTVSGYRIFVSDTCRVDGTIESNGVAGSAGSGTTFGRGGESAVTNTVGNGTAGSNGALAGAQAAVPSGVTGEGGKGGNGGPSALIGGQSTMTVTASYFRTISPQLIRTPSSFYQGGGGGAGGSGTQGYYVLRAGGGGGGGGGIVFLWARRLIVQSGGIIQANGGNGGAGATHTEEGAGGGGSGGGGWVYLLFDELTNNGTIRAIAGTPGTGGGGSVYPGSAGSAGDSGKVTLMNRLTGLFG